MKYRQYISIVVLSVLFFFANGRVEAQDTNYARKVIRILSSDQFHGRGPSYRGDSMAADYIRNELIKMGVQSLGDRYFQKYTYNTFAMEGQCWMRVDGRRLECYKEFRPAQWSKTINRDDVEVMEIPLSTFLDVNALEHFVAKRKKAIADCFVYINTSAIAQMEKNEAEMARREIGKLKRRNPFGSQGIIVGLDALNTVSFSGCEQQHGYTYIEVLNSAMPKKPKQLDLFVNTQFRKDYKTQNVCGYIPGETDTMVVFVAHYDHLGTMGDGYKVASATSGEVKAEGGVTFYGAHDNASGCAAVLDLARFYCKEKPHYTIVVMFFSGEEAGLKGSTYAAQHPLIDFSKVKVLLNIDLFCGGDKGLMVFNAESETTKPYFDQLVRLNEVLQVAPEIKSRKNSPNSDHWPFHSLCPSLYVLTNGQPYGGYHDPADRCEACGLENYNNYLILISSIVDMR